ncbi:MAG: carboxypeptidase regulatory-like domain-containing protein [Candidatus Aminicenantales bacterium]
MSKKILLGFLVLFLSAALAFAQTQTGSIKGIITDEEGNPLPGVTVTASSEALMGKQSYVTTETGAYRFPALPPGHYTITAEMPGFKTVTRSEIIVRVGMVVTIDLTMEMTTIEEEVTVTAASPVVDVEQTKIAVVMDKDLLKNVPLARDLYDIVNSAPGAISENVTYRRTSSIHGSTVRGNTYAFDGVNMNDPVVMYPLTNINFDVMDEVEMVTAGHPASTGYTDGAFINVVTKSGGNRFSGGAVIYYTSEGMNQYLWTDEQLSAMGVTKPSVDKSWIDGSLTFGGPIFPDRLWFFSNGRYIRQEQSTTFVGGFTDPYLGRTHDAYDWTHQEAMGFIKLTAQATQNIKIMGMFNYVDRYRPMYEQPSSTRIFQATRIWDHEKDYTANGVLNYILDQNTFFDIRVGYVHRWFPLPMQEEARGLPRIRDYGAYYQYITTARFNETYLRKRFQVGAYFTRFQDNFLGGNHEFKGGVEFEDAYGDWDWWRQNNLYMYIRSSRGADYLYYYGRRSTHTHSLTGETFTNVGRGRFYFMTCGPESGSSKIIDKARRIGAYIQDSVTFAERLTLNIGVRFDRSWGWKPAVTKAQAGNPLAYYIGETYVRPYTAALYPDRYPNGINPFAEMSTEEWKDIMVWNSLSPRIGLTFDVFGDGRTALKASFGRYTEYMMLQYFSVLHPFYPRYFRFYWYDCDDDGVMDASTEDDYSVYPYDFRVMDPDFAANKLKEGTKSPLTDEFTVGIWHELFKNFSLGVNFIYKDKKNIFEDVIWAPDTNEYWYHIDLAAAQQYWVPFTAIVPSEAYGDTTVTFYVRSNDAPEIFYQARNVPELKRRYWALEFIFNKRMADGWQLSGSVVYSSAYGNIGGWYGESWGWSGAGDSPNFFVNRWGPTSVDRPLQIKLMGTAQLPLRFFLSAYYRFFSGSPWARGCYIVPPDDWCDANNAYSDYYYVNIEEAGSRRNRSWNVLDLRLEKEFRLGDFGTLGIYIDVLNVLGWSGVSIGQNDVYIFYPDAENTTAGSVYTSPSYQVISSVTGVRTLKVSARFRF